MSPEEIAREYIGAKNKRMQIGILADLNLCKKDEIIEILKSNGIEPEPPIKRGRKKKKETDTKDAFRNEGGRVEQSLPEDIKGYLCEQMVALTEQIEQDTNRLEAVNQLLDAYRPREHIALRGSKIC